VRLPLLVVPRSFGCARHAPSEKKLPGFEEKIIALYARGMTVRDIKAMLEAQYHIEVSAELLQ
jgi:putative transposase